MRHRASVRGLAVLLGLAAAAAAEPARFELDVSPREGTVDDTFVATVHLEVMGVAGAERFNAPDFPGFTLLDTKLSTTTSMLFDPSRGQELRTIEVRRYFLQPKSVGRYSVGPARVRRRTRGRPRRYGACASGCRVRRARRVARRAGCGAPAGRRT
jgi:hypothetical protein